MFSQTTLSRCSSMKGTSRRFDPCVNKRFQTSCLKVCQPLGRLELLPDHVADALHSWLLIDPKVFLDDVFQAIKYRSYEPGAPPPPKLSQAQQPFKNERGPAASANPSATGSLISPPQTGSRKRGFQEAADDHDGRDSSHNASLDRAPKQPRRLAGRGRMAEGRGGRRGGHSSLAHPPFPQTLPPFDPNNPLEALMQMQAMGFPYPGMPKLPQQPQWGKSSRRRGRCRDFDTKGFCSRGSTCMFDHGNESIYMPLTMTQLDGKFVPKHSPWPHDENTPAHILREPQRR